MVLLITGILIAVMTGFGARWLFRQRSPDEIHAATEKMRRFRDKDS